MGRFDIKKIFKKTKGFSIKDYIPRRPESIWFLILAFFVVFNIVSLSWSVIIFLEANDIEDIFLEQGIGGSANTINRSELNSLLTTLETRAVTFENYTKTIVQSVVEDEEADEGEADEDEETDENEDVNDGESETPVEQTESAE